MRKLIPVLFLLTTFQAKSQKANIDPDRENFFRFGAKAGLNANKINGKSYKDGFRYNYQLGGFLQFNITRKLGIQPELSFLQSTAEITNDGSDIWDDVLSGDQSGAKLNYLEIPVLLNVDLGLGHRLKFQIGPAFGGLLKQTVDSVKNNAKIYKNAEWSAIGGFWFQLPAVHIGARFKQGLTNINAINNGQTIRNQAIQVFAGITF